MKLLVFNPEHDYAIANNDSNYVALESALQFADDCALFAAYYPFDTGLVFQQCADISSVTQVVPWGWDKAIIKRLKNSGIDSKLLPSDSQMDKIRELSHRRMSSIAMQYILDNSRTPDVLPCPAAMLTDLDMISKFAGEYGNVILKEPYSSNGRGHIIVHESLTSAASNRINKVLLKQGMLLGEPLYNVISNFAMEFYCDSAHNVEFYGYSLFDTDGFSYKKNILASDDKIINHICQLVDYELVDEIKGLLIDFIRENIAEYYEGFLGVDMFVYDDGKVKLNPMVEINLRMTMGVVSHSIFQKKICDSSTGEMSFVYRKNRGELSDFVDMMKREYPLVCRDGRWVSGFESLCPINENTHYGIVVKVLGG